MNENNLNEQKTISWGMIITVAVLLALSLGALIYFLFLSVP